MGRPALLLSLRSSRISAWVYVAVFLSGLLPVTAVATAPVTRDQIQYRVDLYINSSFQIFSGFYASRQEALAATQSYGARFASLTLSDVSSAGAAIRETYTIPPTAPIGFSSYSGCYSSRVFASTRDEVCPTSLNCPGQPENYTFFTPTGNYLPFSSACHCKSNPNASCTYADAECPVGAIYRASTQACMFEYDAAVITLSTKKVDCCVKDGNPVALGLGNKAQTETDYRAANGGLEFVRYYDSDTLVHGSIGRFWRHSYDRELRISASGDATAYRPNGTALHFAPASGGGWTADSNQRERLETLSGGYRLCLSSSSIETYDSGGRLQTITPPSGQVTTLTWDTTSQPTPRLSSVTDAFGRQLQFQYVDQSALLAWQRNSVPLKAVVLPDQTQIQFSYEPGQPAVTLDPAMDRLIGVQYADGTSRSYQYGSSIGAYLLTGIVDENQVQFASWTYDSSFRAISSAHAGGAEQVAVAYPNGGTQVTGALGDVRNYIFGLVKGAYVPVSVTGEPCASCERTKAWDYDANGFLASKTDFNGNVITYVHDARGLETSRTEAFGTPQARTITTQWHANFQLPAQIDEPGRRTTYTYDASGNRLTETILDTSSNASRTTTWSYTAQGLLDTVDGPRTDVVDVTDYDYNSQGDLIRIINALGQVTGIPQRDAHGNPTKIIDPNGIETLLTYDGRQRLKTRSVAGAVTVFDYDSAGQLKKITLPDGSFISYSYDPAHRLTDLQDNLGNKIHYTLDAMSNRTKEEVFDPSSVLRRTQSQVFDSLSRLKEIHGANGQLSEYGYDTQGNRTSDKQASSFTTLSEYDALNRLKKTTDAASGITQYSYNALDQLTSVTDPKTLVTAYEYSAFGETTKLTSPDTGITAYTYDSAGNRKTQTDARGITVTYAYDALSRLTSETYPDTSFNKTYTYDTGPNGIGRLTGIAVPGKSQSWAYSYDARGNLTREASTLSSVTQNTDYQYDAADRVTKITYPTGRVVDYPRDTVGRISQVSTTVGSTTTPLASSIAYLPFGPATSWTLGNGIAVTHAYDQDYRITGYTDTGILNRTLSYDTRDLIIGITDNLTSTRSQTLGYDALERLTSASGAYGSLAYAYDASGDRLSETRGAATTTYSYPGSSHHLSSISGGSAFSYDANGNTTARGAITLTYDSTNRLTGTTNGSSAQTAILYSPSGQRQTQTHTSKTSRYDYDAAGHLIVESSGSVIDAEYVWLNDMPLATIARRNPAASHPALTPVIAPGSLLGGTLASTAPTNPAAPAPELFFFHSDHLNTPQKLTDASKAIVWDASYEPFGTVTLATELLTQPMRFPGQYFDTESGLSQNWMRDYDPSIGRYLESDPIGLKGGFSTYAYVSGNPLIYVDPTGLIKCSCQAIGGGGRDTDKSSPNFQQKVCTYTCRCSCKDGKSKTFAVKDLAGSGDNAICLGQIGPDISYPVPSFERFSFETEGAQGFLNRFVNPFAPSGDMMDFLERGCCGE